MQTLAICDGKFELTAFQVRDEYLEHGTRYQKFCCPECKVPLEAKCIYGERFKKIAHFALPKDTQHNAPCPPKGKERRDAAASRLKFVHGLDVDLPAKLIEARPPRVPPSRPLTDEDIPASGEFLNARQGAARVVDNQPATTMLQVVVEAWTVARKACYKSAPPLKGGAPNHKWVADKLKLYPLALYGKASNYDQAFHKFTSLWRGAVIHYGYNRVELTTDGFSVHATPSISVWRDTKGEALTIPLEYPGIVVVRLEPAGSSRLRDRVHAQLSGAAHSGKAVRWFAFGEMEFDEANRCYAVHVDSCRHIYIDTEL